MSWTLAPVVWSPVFHSQPALWRPVKDAFLATGSGMVSSCAAFHRLPRAGGTQQRRRRSARAHTRRHAQQRTRATQRQAAVSASRVARRASRERRARGGDVAAARQRRMQGVPPPLPGTGARLQRSVGGPARAATQRVRVPHARRRAPVRQSAARGTSTNPHAPGEHSVGGEAKGQEEMISSARTRFSSCTDGLSSLRQVPSRRHRMPASGLSREPGGGSGARPGPDVRR